MSEAKGPPVTPQDLPPLPASCAYVEVWEGAKGELKSANQPYYTADQMRSYALAAVEAARPKDTLCERLQQKCCDMGAYWRSPDAHGVTLTREQAMEILRDALGVEVEITVSLQKVEEPSLESDPPFLF
jgi:hypothetical protein